MKIPMSAPLVAPQGGYSTGAKAGVSAGGRTDACLRAFIDACPDSVVTVDERGRIVQFNQTAEVTFGYARSEILGWPLSRLVVPDVIGDDLAKALKRPGQLCGSDAILNHPIEAAALHRDGTQFTTELVILRFSMEGQTFLNACFHDLCNRRRVEMELRKLAAVTRLNPNALVEFTQDGSVTYFNDAALTLALALGQSDPARIVPQDTAGIVKHCLAEGRPCEAHECVIGERTLSWSFYPNAASAVVHGYGCDVTDKRRLEEQFLRAQRLESIGTLASGIAHDLNNILAPILMSVNLLEETQKDDANARLLDTLRLSTQRGAEMVKQILPLPEDMKEAGR